MFKNLNSKDFAAKKDLSPEGVLLDVRTPEEWVEGIIPEAVTINIMAPDFPAQVAKLDKSKHYFVYCRSGARSANACSFMARQGFTTLHNLEGGIMKWQGEIVPHNS
jgi:rhodanese-related sulfurtransferase